jgi:5-methyltetrahydrofolate--homocysteine methyltransferase
LTPAIKSAIDAASAASLRDSVKTMIGGAPVMAEYARQIGADGYSVNASVAAMAAKPIIGREAP